MRHSKFVALTATLGAAVAAISACGPRQARFAMANTGVAAVAPAKAPALGRAELWSADCTRCHNLRPRTEYSPAQWTVIVNHMRTVADLTGEDYRAMLEFLGDRAAAPANAGRKIAGSKEGRSTKIAVRSP